METLTETVCKEFGNKGVVRDKRARALLWRFPSLLLMDRQVLLDGSFPCPPVAARLKTESLV